MAQPIPSLDFMTAVKLAFARIKDMEGRSRRSEFWWTMLATMIPFLIIWVLNRGAMSIVPSIIFSLLGACIWLCTLPLQVRRLHDTGRGPTLAYIAAGVYIIQLLLSIAIVSQTDFSDPFGTLSRISTLSTFLGLVALIYFVLIIILIVFWCQDSQPGTNQYGPSPKYPDFQ